MLPTILGTGQEWGRRGEGVATQLRKLYPDISFSSLERVCSNVPKENLAHTFFKLLFIYF